MQDVYQNDRLGKARNYLVTQLSDHLNIFNTLDDDLHKHKRRIIGKCVSEKSMREFEPTMMRHIDTLMERLDLSCEAAGSTDMTIYLKRFGFDVVADLGFGDSLSLQTDPQYRWMIRWLEVAHIRNNTHIQAPSVKWLGLDIPLLLFLLIRGDRYTSMVNGLIDGRMSKGVHLKNDFFSLMLGSKNPVTGKKTSIEEFTEEVMFFFPAGGDTATTALCALLFYLSCYPDCYTRLAEEIRSTFPNDEEVRNGPRLAGCHYLRACIDEALRLSPPVPGTLWRELSTEDHDPLVIDGHIIPKGTIVGVNIYSIHHNPEYFPEPFVFKPERWLTAEQEGAPGKAPSVAKAIRNAFTPFSSGSRGCAGKAMAYMECSLVMARILLRFDFERTPGPSVIGGYETSSPAWLRARKDEFQLYDHFSTSHMGPNLVLKRRENE